MRVWILFWFEGIKYLQCVMYHGDILRNLWPLILKKIRKIEKNRKHWFTLGYRINVHVRLFFFVQFPLCTILIRYCTIIFSRPIYYPVRLFSTVRLLFSAFFLRAFLHFLKSESSLIRMFFGSNVLFIKYNVSNS